MGRISSRLWGLLVSLGHAGMSQMGELLKPGSAGHSGKAGQTSSSLPVLLALSQLRTQVWGQYSVHILVHALCLVSPAFLAWGF